MDLSLWWCGSEGVGERVGVERKWSSVLGCGCCVVSLCAFESGALVDVVGGVPLRRCGRAGSGVGGCGDCVQEEKKEDGGGEEVGRWRG